MLAYIQHIHVGWALLLDNTNKLYFRQNQFVVQKESSPNSQLKYTRKFAYFISDELLVSNRTYCLLISLKLKKLSKALLNSSLQ